MPSPSGLQIRRWWSEPYLARDALPVVVVDAYCSRRRAHSDIVTGLICERDSLMRGGIDRKSENVTNLLCDSGGASPRKTTRVWNVAINRMPGASINAQGLRLLVADDT
jgi:hypothetical protein